MSVWVDTGSAPVPSRRQGVHPTPWQAASAAHSTQMLPAERRCPADARAYIQPLGKQQAPHTARKCYSASAQPMPGRTSDPLASSKRRTQHANATGRAPVPSRRQGVHPTASSKRRTQHANATGRAPVPSRRQGVHPTPWQAASAAHSTQRLPAERRCPANARAYIRRTQHANATGRAPVPSRRQGVHPTPGQAASAAHSTQRVYRQSAGAQPTPGRTSDPCSKRRTQHANATGRAPVPSRRQGVHPTPWQAASAAHNTQMLPAERRCPADARTYIRPLGKQQALHTARKCYRQSAGAQPTPGRGKHAGAAHTQMLPAERRCPADARAYIRPLGKQQAPHTARKCYRQSAGAQPTPGRTSDPLATSKRPTQHANATGRAPVPSRHQGVHPTPWQAASAAHSTQMLPAERRCPADARAYIRPLGKQQAPHTARKGYRQSAGAQPTPGRASDAHSTLNATGRAPVPSRRHGVHPTPWQAASATHSTQRLPAERRCPPDARAYIRPLGKQQAPHTARKCYRQSAGAQPTPGRTSDPLASSKRRTQHANATGRAPVPSRRQGVHPTPWQAASAAHSTQRLPAERRCPADARAYIRRTQHANCRAPNRRQGVHPTPWQAASAAHSTQRLPAERRCPADARAYIRPLGKQQAPHTARKCPAERRCPADARAYIRPLGKQQAPHTARKCYRQSAGAQPTPGRTSDPLASSKRRTQHANATGRAPVPSRRQGVHPTPWQAASAVHSTQMLLAERRCPADARAYIRRTQHANATGRAPVPSRRQGVHPTPWQAASAAHSTQTLPAERRCPADARAYIRPLGKQQAPHAARKCYTGRAPVPRRRQGVHPTPWQAASAAHTTEMLPAERQCPADARAYIRPLGKQQAPHTARKCYRQSAGAQPTPGRTSDPLASSKRRTQHANATGRAPVPNRRQGVHPTPWQATSAAHSAQTLPAERRCPADARAYIRPLGKLCE